MDNIAKNTSKPTTQSPSSEVKLLLDMQQFSDDSLQCSNQFIFISILRLQNKI